MHTATINNCYTLAKFAYATGIDGPNIPWTKLQASTLFAIIQGECSSLSLRVVQKTTVLESVNISPHIARARHILDGAPHFPAQQLPIFGITRNAALALRYYLEDGRARRIQMTFESISECRQVVETLARCGLSFQENEHTNLRPGTASSLSRPVPNQYALRHGESVRSQSLNSFKPNPLSSTGTTEHTPSQHTVTLQSLQMPELPMSQPNSGHAQQSQHNPHPQIDLPRPPAFTRDEAAAPREPPLSRPTTSQFFARDNTFPAYTQSNHLPNVDEALRPSSVLGQTAYNSPAMLSSEREFRQHQKDGPSSRTFGSDPSNAMTSSTHREIRPADQQQFLTPRSTTAVPTSLPYSLEVPTFAQGTSELRYNDSGRVASSRPLSSSLTLPPLPKPRILKEVSPNITNGSSPYQTAQSASDRVSSPSLKRPLDSAIRSDQTPRLPLFAEINSRSSLRESSMTQEVPSDQVISANDRPSKVSRLVKLPISNGDDLPSLGSGATEHPRPPGLSSQEGRPEPFDRLTRTYGKKLSPEAPRQPSGSPNGGISSLEEYAMQNAECRQAALDQLFISHLENPAFLRLCEDVQSNWRRFALGL